MEGIFSGGELLNPVTGEIPDDSSFSDMDGLHVRRRAGDSQSEDATLPGVVQHLGAVEQRLRRHAAAQNAEPAERLGAVDDRDRLSAGGGDSRRIEAGATSADDNEIVGFHSL